MPRGKCPRHPVDYPCTCAMGHLYRFIEPVLLLMIRERGQAYGYDLREIWQITHLRMRISKEPRFIAR